MAEALLKKMLDEAGRSDIGVFSAGTFAIGGQRASLESRAAMEEYGLSLKDHRSALLTREMCDRADAILTMEAWHIGDVLSRNPRNIDKTHTLKGYAYGILGFPGEGYNVRDPYHGTIEVYRACAKEIQELLSLALPLICKDLNGEGPNGKFFLSPPDGRG